MGWIKSKHGEGIRKCSRNKYIGIGCILAEAIFWIL